MMLKLVGWVCDHGFEDNSLVARPSVGEMMLEEEEEAAAILLWNTTEIHRLTVQTHRQPLSQRVLKAV